MVTSRQRCLSDTTNFIEEGVNRFNLKSRGHALMLRRSKSEHLRQTEEQDKGREGSRHRKQSKASQKR